ncbi:MmgE/PrpD family protein [Novosphingobium lentum]|uniref:MmgE/PrpD family protein n=1 Tax=Novosphingobium lentum TaxID=145287 RepID=UPI001FDEB106|nr:MmgE/PrpD family protein [Novosphingobium lentum]
MADDPAGALARMVIETPYEAIPAAVIALAKRAILDTLSVLIAGSSWEVVPGIVDLVAEWGGAEQGTVLVYGHRVPAPMAAFANGVMARAIDMGDVHETGGHVTEWNVPTMLSALGLADRPVTGREFLAAYVTGAELSVRCSAALNMPRYQPVAGIPGEWYGSLCSAASVSRMLGRSVDETWNALGICYSVHSLSEHSKYAEGTQMARVQHSFAGDTAIKAVLLTRRGVTGPRGIFRGEPAGILRHVGWDDVNPERLTDGLGTRWHLAEGLSMKPYPACKFTHSFIASTITLMQRHAIDHRMIARIDAVGSNGARMTFEPAQAKWHPVTVPEAMFSAPYAIATAAIEQRFFLDDLHPAEIARADKRALMERIHITFDAANPQEFEGFPVAITLRDGTVHRCTTPFTKGHTDNPFSTQDQIAKLAACARFAAVPFADERLAELVRLCGDLEHVPDMQAVVDVLTPGRGA